MDETAKLRGGDGPEGAEVVMDLVKVVEMMDPAIAGELVPLYHWLVFVFGCAGGGSTLSKFGGGWRPYLAR